MITISRRSPFSGKVNNMTLPMTQQEYDDACLKYSHGGLIQSCFPSLTPGQREFIKTGITEQEWDNMFGGEDE